MYFTTCISLHVSQYMYLTTCISLHVSHYMYLTTCISLHVFHYMYLTTCISLHVFHYMYLTTCISLHVSHYMYLTTCISLHVSHYMTFIRFCWTVRTDGQTDRWPSLCSQLLLSQRLVLDQKTLRIMGGAYTHSMSNNLQPNLYDHSLVYSMRDVYFASRRF